MAERKDVCVIAHDATYGNAAELAKALQCKLTLFSEDFKKMHTKYPYQKTIQKADEYILVGAFVLRDLKPSFYQNKNVKIVVTDSTYLREYRTLNKLFSQYNWEVHAMPDLMKYGQMKNVYYQPFDIDIPIVKNKELTVCHSPATPLKFEQKGTLLIAKTVKKFDVKFDFIIDVPQEETIQRRAKCHIFVDQLYRGLGKSGLEAMLTKCLVLSGVKPDYDHLPPVVWITEDTLEETLRYYIDHPKERERKALEQYRWAKENLSYEAVVDRLYESTVLSG